MAAPPWAGTMKMTLNWSFNSQPWWQNVLFYYGGVASNFPVTQATADDADATVKAALTSSGLVSRISNVCRLESVTVQATYSTVLPEFTGSGASVIGTATGDALPLQDAICITHRTAFIGRSYRGRTYFGGFTEASNNSDNTVQVGTATDVEDFINAIKTLSLDPGPNTWNLAIVSRTLPSLSDVNLVTSSVVRDRVWDTQRRRRDGITSF